MAAASNEIKIPSGSARRGGKGDAAPRRITTPRRHAPPVRRITPREKPEERKMTVLLNLIQHNEDEVQEDPPEIRLSPCMGGGRGVVVVVGGGVLMVLDVGVKNRGSRKNHKMVKKKKQQQGAARRSSRGATAAAAAAEEPWCLRTSEEMGSLLKMVSLLRGRAVRVPPAADLLVSSSTCTKEPETDTETPETETPETETSSPLRGRQRLAVENIIRKPQGPQQGPRGARRAGPRDFVDDHKRTGRNGDEADAAATVPPPPRRPPGSPPRVFPPRVLFICDSREERQQQLCFNAPSAPGLGACELKAISFDVILRKWTEQTMSNEHTPLLVSGVCGLAVGMATACGSGQDGETPGSGGAPAATTKKESRKLDTFFGVMVPTILSMFSIVLFLRTGFVVGHAGLFQGLLMLLVAYTIISLTILSICAISTNGAIKGGGAYCILVRAAIM
ncbi:Solute carrier family 12 member 9 [Merluccius polli]|uniref:Solute carrier family 12 member 9 n=1 Tax=Merluccius polli TaxID=89951 RepID=A0AA47MC84_MERPO|nr:Solute carrier family 12 member 9 [Merluccius polli]